MSGDAGSAASEDQRAKGSNSLPIAAAAWVIAVYESAADRNFSERGAVGVDETIRVVDGQQRLTTVSIVLACIAAELEREGPCGDWTAQIIRADRLTNCGKPPEKHRKLGLQDGDDEEYRLGLEGDPAGAGAVTQAWRIARRLAPAKGGLVRASVPSVPDSLLAAA